MSRQVQAVCLCEDVDVQRARDVSDVLQEPPEKKGKKERSEVAITQNTYHYIKERALVQTVYALHGAIEGQSHL